MKDFKQFYQLREDVEKNVLDILHGASLEMENASRILEQDPRTAKFGRTALELGQRILNLRKTLEVLNFETTKANGPLLTEKKKKGATVSSKNGSIAVP